MITNRLNQLAALLTAVTLMITLSSPVLAQQSVQASNDKNAIAANKKIVMIVSGYGRQKSQEHAEQPGYEFDEFAKAYLVFKANGIEVDVASPKGGKVEADQFDTSKPYNVPVLADNAIIHKLENTMPTATLNANDYDGIFIVGGKGAMFDLPKDKALQNLIADIYQQQGSVAAVCHGPAALVDVKLKDGSYLIANKKINGFTNKEEQLFGKKWLKHFEFMLEDKLIERGAKFQSSDIMLSHVAIDKRLVTGQNPTSTTDVAVELVKSIGIKPVATEYFVDDKTMAVVSQFLAGDKTALAQLRQEPEQYHIALLGMYGFYYVKGATNDTQYQNALTLMLVAQPVINNPRLDMKIAQTQHKLGKLDEAKATLNNILTSKPDYQAAVDMLESIAL